MTRLSALLLAFCAYATGYALVPLFGAGMPRGLALFLLLLIVVFFVSMGVFLYSLTGWLTHENQ